MLLSFLSRERPHSSLLWRSRSLLLSACFAPRRRQSFFSDLESMIEGSVLHHLINSGRTIKHLRISSVTNLLPAISWIDYCAVAQFLWEFNLNPQMKFNRSNDTVSGLLMPVCGVQLFSSLFETSLPHWRCSQLCSEMCKYLCHLLCSVLCSCATSCDLPEKPAAPRFDVTFQVSS